METEGPMADLRVEVQSVEALLEFLLEKLVERGGENQVEIAVTPVFIAVDVVCEETAVHGSQVAQLEAVGKRDRQTEVFLDSLVEFAQTERHNLDVGRESFYLRGMVGQDEEIQE